MTVIGQSCVLRVCTPTQVCSWNCAALEGFCIMSRGSFMKRNERQGVCALCVFCACVQGFTSTLCHSNLITLNLRCFSMPVNGTLHNILICSIVACSLMKEHHYTVHLFLSIHCYVQQTVHFCINAYFCAYYIAVLWNISSVKHNPAYPCTLCVIC